MSRELALFYHPSGEIYRFKLLKVQIMYEVPKVIWKYFESDENPNIPITPNVSEEIEAAYQEYEVHFKSLQSTTFMKLFLENWWSLVH